MTALLIPMIAAAMSGLYLALVALRAGDSAHFDVTPLSIGFALAAGLAVASGAVALLRLRQGSVGPRFALAVGALVFALLALFSIGVLILPIALLLLAFAVRDLRRRRSSPAARAAAAGAAIGVGAIAYLLVLLQPAVAECRPNGGSATSSGGLFGTISSSSGSYSTPSGESGGYIDEGDRITSFSCRDGRMTDFHRTSLPQGNWVVTTQPFATVGRSVLIVFRVRPKGPDDPGLPADGFDFTATCRTCPQPQPTVRGRAVLARPRAPGGSLTFSAQVVFPAMGSWYTTPYDAPIEVR